MSGLSREDRTTLSRFSTGDVGTSRVGRAVARALALIDQQEKALEAADELARAAEYAEKWGTESALSEFRATLADYRSARPTSTKEDG